MGQYVERAPRLPILQDQRAGTTLPPPRHIAASILVGSGLKENAPQLHSQPQTQVQSQNKYDGKKM
jgi:hypothetical protein